MRCLRFVVLLLTQRLTLFVSVAGHSRLFDDLERFVGVQEHFGNHAGFIGRKKVLSRPVIVTERSNNWTVQYVFCSSNGSFEYPI